MTTKENVTAEMQNQYKIKFGDFPQGWHLHHIVSLHAGGSNDIDNLIAVSPMKHAQIHYNNWLASGEIKELQAVALIERDNSEVNILTPEERSQANVKESKSITRFGDFSPSWPITNMSQPYVDAVLRDPLVKGFETVIVEMRLEGVTKQVITIDSSSKKFTVKTK